MISFFVAGTPAGQGSKTFYGKGRMAEYLQELETTSNTHQATLNEGGFSDATKQEQP